MKSVVAVLLVIIMFGGCSDKPGKEAYLALKKVEEKTIAENYIGYRKAMERAAYEIHKFGKQNEDKMAEYQGDKLQTSFYGLKSATIHLDMLYIQRIYLFAEELWNDKAETWQPLNVNSELYKKINFYYPELVKEVNDKEKENTNTVNSDELRLALWRKASSDLKKISKQYE